MRRNKEIPGDTIASQRAFDKEMVGRGVLLGRLEGYVDAYAEDEVFIQGITIRVPQDIGTDVLVVVRAVAAGESVVAYHAAPTLGEAIVGMGRRMQNKSLRWKEDKYA